MSGHPQPRPDLAGTRVCVAGAGVAGASAARALVRLGAEVVTADRRDGSDSALPAGAELVVTSPGWRPDQPLLVAAGEAGVPVWGDVELAWRLRPEGQEWLGVTGTNGKTTTVQMLESMLRSAGLRAVACGNVGLPVLDATLDEEPYEVLAVEVSSFQLHWMRTVEFRAAALLNVAADHLDWHGSMAAYTAAKASIWRGEPYAVYNADDPVVAALAQSWHDSHHGSDGSRDRRLAFSLGPPDRHCFGVHGDVLVDRCFGVGNESETRREGAGGVELARLADVRPPAPHNVANALAAAALARALGSAGRFPVPPSAVRAGLCAFTPGSHRIAMVAARRGVTYVDDSKATNPHAAAASLAAFDRAVWIAGGLAKGARFDELVAAAAGRLRGVVLLGRDRAHVAQALARHAPQIPVVEVTRTDTGAMDDVVRAATGLARPGDTVLLAPACASMDMFHDYAARGDAFADAVRRLDP